MACTLAAFVARFRVRNPHGATQGGKPSLKLASKRHLKMDGSGQIIATSHDLTPNGGLVREIPLFQGNLGW